MSLKVKPYFCDNQIKRYLVQIMSCFAGYQVRTGLQKDGKPRFITVPVIYGDIGRISGYVLNGGSENVMNTVPVISVYMSNLTQKAEWRQAPQHFERYEFYERLTSPDGELLDTKGRARIVERYMPVPYDMDLNVSIWASNNDQGYQLIEQIATVFNPDQDIQLSNSPTDWAFLTSLFFGGDINFEKAVPSGTDVDPLYVYNLPFNTFIYLSPPVKVYDAKPIYEIHVPILEIEDNIDFDAMTELDELVIRADEQDILKFENG